MQQVPNDAAKAIMTTDTVEKEYALEVELDGKTVTIGGITKGSGMIQSEHGNHAWFLIDRCLYYAVELLNEALHKAIEDTFNMVSVDGDTSTNDIGVRYWRPVWQKTKPLQKKIMIMNCLHKH